MDNDQVSAPEPDPGDATAPPTPDQIKAAGSTAGESQQLPRKFAHYEIIDELGRGGMGVVYKAFDPNLKRTVALKVLLSAEHASEEEIQRFFREASSAAKLQHPNIVPIHDLQVHEGKHYYTMDFIDGEPLGEITKSGRLSARDSAELVRKVAQALHYAHINGVIHRDLKPENIVIGADREPKILDFGLAKLTGDEATRLTQSGAAMGTIYYESPEQASGRSHQVDARSDVYSLGCIFYEMLTGVPPFVSSSALEVLRMHVEDEPVRPRARGSKVAPDIEAICLKCLEKDPERRYRSANALADDLERFLNGEAVSARRYSPVRKAVRLAKLYFVLSFVPVVFGVLLFAWAFYATRFSRATYEAEIKENGARTALFLAALGKEYIREYKERKKDNPGEMWKTKQIPGLTRFQARRGRSELSGVLDAFVLHGDTLIAKAGPHSTPLSLKGKNEAIGGKHFENVRCIRGSFARRSRGGVKESIPCLQFIAGFDVDGSKVKGTARVIVSTSSVDKRMASFSKVLYGTSIPVLVAGVLLVSLTARRMIRSRQKKQADRDSKRSARRIVQRRASRKRRVRKGDGA